MRPGEAGRVGRGEIEKIRRLRHQAGREGGGAFLRSVPGEPCPGPSMQLPMGPACIFLRKGIAEKQRVRWGTLDGGQGRVSWDVGKEGACWVPWTKGVGGSMN